MTFSKKTLSIKGLFATLSLMTSSINDTQHNTTLSVIMPNVAFYSLLCSMSLWWGSWRHPIPQMLDSAEHVARANTLAYFTEKEHFIWFASDWNMKWHRLFFFIFSQNFLWQRHKCSTNRLRIRSRECSTATKTRRFDFFLL